MQVFHVSFGCVSNYLEPMRRLSLFTLPFTESIKRVQSQALFKQRKVPDRSGWLTNEMVFLLQQQFGASREEIALRLLLATPRRKHTHPTQQT